MVDVAIVGSGVVGAALAYRLCQRGHTVDVFEKGPDYPYPPTGPFQDRVVHLLSDDPHQPAADVGHLTQSGDYPLPIGSERLQRAGGSATRWSALTPRMGLADFGPLGETLGWPLSYADLEPYYVQAEAHLGVSGSDTDNPFAPWRSAGYPLPAFPLGHDDRRFAARLRDAGIALHTVPQARTSRPYGVRPACQNFGACGVCPIGARYAPNFHLQAAVATGRCRVHLGAAVRRILMEGPRARGILWQPVDADAFDEHPARVVVVAAGAIESARLLLLSRDHPAHADGVGNAAGHVGQRLMFNHIWTAHLHYRDLLHPLQHGPPTAECHQFLDPPGRGQHGGIKVEFFGAGQSHLPEIPELPWADGAAVLAALRPLLRCRALGLHAEARPNPARRVTLSSARDRFGDPVAHVHYQLDDFDHRTHGFATALCRRFAQATAAAEVHLPRIGQYWSGHHHLGTCRMAARPADGVVDAHGRVHGTRGLYVLGGSSFPSAPPVNPTLTMVALALRAADHVDAALRGP